MKWPGYEEEVEGEEEGDIEGYSDSDSDLQGVFPKFGISQSMCSHYSLVLSIFFTCNLSPFLHAIERKKSESLGMRLESHTYSPR